MERETGYYHVVIRNKRKRVVAFYFNDEDHWIILGSRGIYTDSHFDLIGDRLKLVTKPKTDD